MGSHEECRCRVPSLTARAPNKRCPRGPEVWRCSRTFPKTTHHTKNEKGDETLSPSLLFFVIRR